MLTRFANIESVISHLSEIQRLTHIGSWELDLLTNSLTWSDQIYTIFEIDPDSFDGSYEAFLNAVHPEDRQKVDQAYSKSVKDKLPYEITHRLLMRDGRIKFVQERGETSYDASGSPVRSVGTVQDITKEMESKNALEESRTNLLHAERLANFGHYKLMRGEDTFLWSEGVYRILGKTPGVFTPTSENILNLLHPEDRPILQEYRNKILNEQFDEPLLVRVCKENGEIAYIEGWSQPLVGFDHSVVGLFGTLQDVTWRVEAEARGAENVRRYELVERAVNDGVWDWDLVRGDVYVSPRWKAILGYSPEDPTGVEKNYYALLHPDDTQEFEKWFIAHVRDGIPFCREFRRLHKDGTYRWVRCRASALKDSGGRPYRMVGSMTDITVEKEAADARNVLEQSLALQNAIAEAPVPIAMFDTNMRCLRASNRWRSYVGRRGNDVDGEVLDLTHDRIPTSWIVAFEKAIRERSAETEEVPWKLTNGDIARLKVLLRAWNDARGNIGGVVAYIDDLTPQREAESERLRTASLFAWMEKVSISIPGIIGTCKLDTEGHFSFPQLSKQAFDVLGFIAEDLHDSADPFFDQVFDEDLARIKASLFQSARNVSPWHEEFRYNHPMKGQIWLGGRSNPEMLSDGSVIWHGFVEDITERKILEIEAFHKTELLHQAQKMELVGQLSAGIAHDFNNLLAVISGSMEFVSDWMRTGALPDHKLIAAAHSACHRGKELVQRLLNFSRQVPIKPTHSAIDPLILELLTILQRTLGEAIEIKTNLMVGDATAFIDRSQFTSAILNLALNSRDAMACGGELTINTWLEPSKGSESDGDRSKNENGIICVEVVDTGCGMTEEVRLRACDPGFTTKPIGLGTGIGLSLVSSFVKQAGGDINIKTQAGRGTTITLYLPRSVPSSVIDNGFDKQVGLAPSERNGTVLLVEDDSDVRAIIGAQLSKLNYDVRYSTTGDEALDILSSPAQFKVLLTDVILRGAIDGIDIVKEALRLRPKLGVICMSGYSTPERQIERLRLQNIQLLQKPFRISQLAEALERLKVDLPP